MSKINEIDSFASAQRAKISDGKLPAPVVLTGVVTNTMEDGDHHLVFDPAKILPDKNLETNEIALSQRTTRLEGSSSAVFEGRIVATVGSETINKMSAIIVTCCDMDYIFDVGITPPPNADWKVALSSIWVNIPKAAAFQCHKCQEWTLVQPGHDKRLVVTKVKSFSPEISLLLRLLLELGDCIADNGLDLDGGCGECPYCLLKAKFK